MGIVQENEIYVNDDRLCFLFSLLIKNGASISCANKHIADEFTENFEVFVSEIFETYIQTLSSQRQKQIMNELSDYDSGRIPYEYNDWYEITYSDKNKVLSITLKENGVLLYEILSRYANNHREDDLCTWNETNHYCSNKICSDFYQQIQDYNAKTYYVKDIKNIHAIVLGYFKGYIEIKSIECEIDLSEIGYMLTQPCYVNEYPTNAVTHFKCCINADSFKKEFDKFIKEQGNKVSELPTNKKITKYPPQQQIMYDFIVNSIKKSGRYKIDPSKLRKILNIGNSEKDTDVLNSAVSLLNKCYREINKTANPLLKKVKRTDLYDISLDFKI